MDLALGGLYVAWLTGPSDRSLASAAYRLEWFGTALRWLLA